MYMYILLAHVHVHITCEQDNYGDCALRLCVKFIIQPFSIEQGYGANTVHKIEPRVQSSAVCALPLSLPPLPTVECGDSDV